MLLQLNEKKKVIVATEAEKKARIFLRLHSLSLLELQTQQLASWNKTRNSYFNSSAVFEIESPQKD